MDTIPEDEDKGHNNRKRDDYVQTAWAEHWKENPELELEDYLSKPGSTARIEDVRARITSDIHRWESVESIRGSMRQISKDGKASKAKMLGLLSDEEIEDKKAKRWSVKRARKYLKETDRLVPQEYQEFLDSNEWRTFSAAEKRKRNFTCEMCLIGPNGSGRGLQCHHVHTSPERRLDPSNIWVLCDGCHSEVHYIRDHQAELMADEDFELPGF